jgi:mono/diheme cytochrome c family protein/plastocyanin
MKREIIARILVVLFMITAVAIPLAGYWISSVTRANTIEMHARMPENGGWSLETIQAQVGQPIHLRITSDDVVHGFTIGQYDQPSLDIKPGEFVETTLTFDKPGKYTFYCTRWCGPNHWRMRGTIEVAGPAQADPPSALPLYLKLGLDIDAPHLAAVTPTSRPSAEHGAQLINQLPAYSVDRAAYLSTSPAQLWQQMRAEPNLSQFSDSDLWDMVYAVWQNQTTPDKLAEGQKLFAANCAACHGETGKGDGVMVRGLPPLDPITMGHNLVRPPDFTDPQNLLGASPALLEGKIIRGGMGTGMPYWGPILTADQLDAIVSYLYSFAWKSAGANLTPSPSP